MQDDQRVWDARHNLARYFVFDHDERLQQALGYRTPAAVYRGWDRGLSRVRVKYAIEALELHLCCPQNVLTMGSTSRFKSLPNLVI